jgi:16S rRNA (guanine527-N7)-methyltransferase
MNNAEVQALGAVLSEAEALGFLTEAPHQTELAVGFASLVRTGGWWVDGAVGVDLGSGGGVPGLALAIELPGTWHLVEVSGTRARFLRRAASTLGLVNVVVLEADAASLRNSPLLAAASVVSARSFAKPAVTAECAAPLLTSAGVLVVAEPPEGDRWPAEGLASVGLIPVANLSGPPRLQLVGRDEQLSLAPARSFRAIRTSPKF